MKFYNTLSLGVIAMFLLACNNGPKVITSNETPSAKYDSGIFSEEDNQTIEAPMESGGFTENLHTVVVSKILPTEKYIYLNVTEGGKQFWIATGKQEVNVGDTYFYRDGLLKTNFESKEYKRVFDTIYLVSKFVPKNHGGNTGNLTANFAEGNSKNPQLSQKETIPTHTEEIKQHKGSIKIAELVANPSAYEGKTVQITGKVVKVNPNIMDRNWIHLQDGSKNDFDLVVTSNTFVPEGKIITIRAEVGLNRDFGAGYRYDLILENGTIIE
ncbi:GW dipeptide domain-containing protein [Aequorivita antarctica]|nr:GW dipeptide domain-containing protein [Aequorivita antarctica]SRX72407.1 hypothetical protein AEQU3_00241 [Aequorivita antarctica]